jgi:membrane fusion protein, multidrug efflux system
MLVKKTATCLFALAVTLGLSACKKAETPSASAAAPGSSAPAAKSGDSIPSTPSAPPRESTLVVSPSDLIIASRTNFVATQDVSGSLKAQRQSLVKSKSAGEVIEFTVREGSPVKAGARVARIDDLDARLRLNERNASKQAAQAQLNLAQRTFNNQRQLFEKGFISQAALDSAQSQLDVARANFDSTTAALALVDKSIRDAIVTSPINGVVSEIYVQRGEKVTSDARLLSIIDLSSIEFEALVPAELAVRLSINDVVNVTIDGIPQPVAGRIERINPSTLGGARTVPVHIALSNQQSLGLKAGLFAIGRFTTAKKLNAVVIPLSAVRESAGKKFVYVVSASNKSISERPISLGINDGSQTEVTGGLEAGETIIANNLGPIRLGTQIDIAKPAAPAAQSK